MEDPSFLSLDDHKELKEYLHDRRKQLGGYLPQRNTSKELLEASSDLFKEFSLETEREQSTTMVFVRLLTKILRDKSVGSRVVPIVPDEARTFGMDSMFRQFGIYSSEGQKYEPEDADKVMFYRESESGIMLEEGINEAGAFSAWLALATSYANNNLPMIPFYIYYSMFGFQRIHDLAWAAGDSRAKGFLLGATAGRTTLNGEGLQHQDGHSHILSATIPNCRSYDPAFAYEVATIVEHGMIDMYQLNNDRFYYITLMNENYSHPARPDNASAEAIMKGAYQYNNEKSADIRILASGVTLNFAISAEQELKGYGIKAEIWSITSFNELYRNAIEEERKKTFNLDSSKSYVEECFGKALPTVAVSEYMRAHSNQIRQWIHGDYLILGTDGFGRSDSREQLRHFFEVDRKFIVLSALSALVKQGQLENAVLDRAIDQLGIKRDKPNPVKS